MARTCSAEAVMAVEEVKEVGSDGGVVCFDFDPAAALRVK